MAYSLREHECDSPSSQQILDYFGDFDIAPALDLVRALSDPAAFKGDWSQEADALQMAFRFIRWNHLHGWPITATWRSAFKGFKTALRGIISIGG